MQPKILGQSAGDAGFRPSSSAKARELLGWQAETSLEAGLRKTIDWYWVNQGTMGEKQNR